MRKLHKVTGAGHVRRLEYRQQTIMTSKDIGNSVAHYLEQDQRTLIPEGFEVDKVEVMMKFTIKEKPNQPSISGHPETEQGRLDRSAYLTYVERNEGQRMTQISRKTANELFKPFTDKVEEYQNKQKQSTFDGRTLWKDEYGRTICEIWHAYERDSYWASYEMISHYTQKLNQSRNGQAT